MLVCIFLLPRLPAFAADVVDLSGSWKFKADWSENGLASGWQKVEFDDSAWRDILVPGTWEEQGVRTNNPRWPAGGPDDGYNGYAWYRRHVQLPADWGQTRATLRIGAIDDMDWTYINGQLVGSTTAERSFDQLREYAITPGVLRPGADNIVAIRVLDMKGVGGIVNKPVEIERESPAPVAAPEKPEAPEAPVAPSPPTREKRGDMIQVFGSVTVPEGTRVQGDAVAVGGSVHVHGYVTGDVVAVGGSVRLMPDSRVDGDVTAVGGSVNRDESATVKGSVTQVTLFPWAMPGLGFLAWPFALGHFSALNDFLRRLISWGILGLILALLMPKRLETIDRKSVV